MLLTHPSSSCPAVVPLAVSEARVQPAHLEPSPSANSASVGPGRRLTISPLRHLRLVPQPRRCRERAVAAASLPAASPAYTKTDCDDDAVQGVHCKPFRE